MADRFELASEFAGKRPDPFADLAAEMAEQLEAVSPASLLVDARGIAVLAAAVRASYALSVGDRLAYAGFHVASTFGFTGHLDLVVSSPALSRLAEDAVNRHTLSETIRVHLGQPRDVVTSLNGPIDFIAVDLPPSTCHELYESLVRMLRTGGCLVFQPWQLEPEDELGGELLDRLASDERLYAHLPATESPAIAVRRR